MPDPSVSGLAQSIRRHSERAVGFHGRHIGRATIEQIDPLRALLHEHSLMLDENDIEWGKAIESYDTNVGLDVGDTLLVIELGDGKFYALDVRGEADLANPPVGPAGGVLAGSFPNPSFAVDMALQSELNTHAAQTGLGAHIPATGVDASMIADNSVGVAEIGTLPYCRANTNAAQPIGNNATITVDFAGGDSFNTVGTGMHNPGSGTLSTRQRLIATVGGTYIMSATVEVSAPGTAPMQMGIEINLNGGGSIAHHYETDITTANVTRRTIHTSYRLAASEFIVLMVYQLSAAPPPAVNLNTAHLEMAWVSD